MEVGRLNRKKLARAERKYCQREQRREWEKTEVNVSDARRTIIIVFVR